LRKPSEATSHGKLAAMPDAAMVPDLKLSRKQNRSSTPRPS
jgi:hypothetical protein